MYRCQNCNCQSESGVPQNKVVLEERDVKYMNEEGKVSEGFETVKEVTVCAPCVVALPNG